MTSYQIHKEKLLKKLHATFSHLGTLRSGLLIVYSLNYHEIIRIFLILVGSFIQKGLERCCAHWEEDPSDSLWVCCFEGAASYWLDFGEEKYGQKN